jgi:sugar lactone lactonase YvrE
MKCVLTIIFLLCGVLRVSAQTLPTITTQPQNLALNPGDTGALTVAATSTGAVSYRWFKNGAAMADSSGITGTLTATLSFASALTTDSGNYYVVVSNSAGSVTSSTAALTVAIISAPVITSVNTLSSIPGNAVSFAIIATHQPTNFSALGLPAGLTINSSTGLISGTPLAVGSYAVTLSASNSIGTGTQLFTLNLTAIPVITSADSLLVQDSQPVNFTVTASSAPTVYKASGLPSGLSINAATGVITGNAPADGGYYTSQRTYVIELSATNSVGTGTQNLTLSVYKSKNGGKNGYAAQLLAPSPGASDLAVDSAGNVFFTDSINHTVNKIASDGSTSVFAGKSGQAGSLDGNTLTASFLSPSGISVDSNGTLFVADTGNHTIRKITKEGVVSTLAGSVGIAGSADGTASQARFFSPQGITVDTLGAIYVADTGNNTIRKISTVGAVSTLAGSAGLSGSTDGVGQSARFNTPIALALDADFNLYVTDRGNNRIRKIAPAGNTANHVSINSPNGIYVTKLGVIYCSTSDGIFLTNVNGATIKQWSALDSSYYHPPHNIILKRYGEATPDYSVMDFRFDNIDVSAPIAMAANLSGDLLWINSKPLSYTVEAFNSLNPSYVTTLAAGVVKASAYSPVAIASGIRNNEGVGYTVDATGTPLSYDWYWNYTPIGGTGNYGAVFLGTSKMLDASKIPFDYTPYYNNNYYRFGSPSSGCLTAIASNVGSLSIISTTVNAAAPLPLISTDLKPQSVVLGQTVVFSIVTNAAFPSALEYEWFFNGKSIGSTRQQSLTIPNTQPSDEGNYYVIVKYAPNAYSNTSGVGSVAFIPSKVTSSTAALTVIPPVAPVITTQPQAISLKVGASGTLSVTATGAPDPTYQWKKDGVAITGATSATYTLSSVATKDAGDYTVVVSNSAGSAISNSATLTVTSTVIPPAITTQPGSLTVISGAPASMSVVASGTAPLAYQWSLDGSTISGANSTTYTLPAAASRNAGSYTCVITNSAGSVTSTAAILTVNTAPAITAQPANQTVIAGSTTTLSVTATGNPAVTYQWRKDGVNLSGATSNALSLSNVTSANAGSYTCVITNTVGSITSNSATLTVNPSSALANLSVRTTMATGQTLIVGAVVRGGSKNVLIRAGGPALNQFGLVGMTDPNLEVYASGNALVAANNDWPATLKTTFASVGAFPFVDGSKDSALIQAFEGSFTALARGIGPGALLIEAYDTTGGTAARLINVSARNQVGTGGDVLIAGFVINGTGTKQLLIRGVGPGLGQFGVTGFLADPKIQVYDSKNAEVASNDNWTASLATTFSSVGAFNLPANSKDAALLVTLAAGASYTVIVSGADGGTGDGIVEIYEVAP